MINVVNEKVPDFLEHFGIKGMRWRYKKGAKPLPNQLRPTSSYDPKGIPDPSGTKATPGLDFHTNVSVEDFKQMRNLMTGSGVGTGQGVSTAKQPPGKISLEEARKNRNLIIGSGIALRTGLNKDVGAVAKKLVSSYASVPISTIRRKQS